MLTNFGSSYTFSNIDNEEYLTVAYLHICMKATIQAQNLAQESAGSGKTFYAPGVLSSDN